MQAYVRLDECERMQHPRAWLLKVLYHRFVDMHRGRRRNPLALSETGADRAEYEQPADRSWQPEEQADRALRLRRILGAMSCLNADDCALVAMHDVDGLTIEELSAHTGLPGGTIKARLHRTRARLGRLLAGDRDLNPRLAVVGDE